VGTLVSIRRWRTWGPGRALVVLLCMSLLLSFGRTTFGGLTVLLPGSKDIFMRRFMMGAQLAGVYLAGIGGVALVRTLWRLLQRWRAPSARWEAAPTRRIALVAISVAVGVAVLTPAWTHIDTFAATNTQWVNAQQNADRSQGRQVDRLIAYVRTNGGGRVYAGMPSNWGSQFTVGAVPVFKYLESRDVDEVGYTLRTASLMTDPEYYFDEEQAGDFALFGVHYLILPLGQAPPVPARLVMAAGPYRLWVLPNSGYVRVVDTVGVLSADRTNVGVMSVPYLRSSLPGSGRYLAVAYGGAAPAPLTGPTSADGGGTAGAVRTERDDLADGHVTAIVNARRTASVVLSASFDPGWAVRVDGRAVPVEMLAPALPAVLVGPGVHVVTFSYGGFGLYPELFAVLVVTMAALVWAGPFDGVNRVRRRR